MSGTGRTSRAGRWTLRRALGSVATVLTAAALAAAPARVGAQPDHAITVFNLSAAASGVHVIVAMPGFVVVDRFIDGGGPTAQAALSALEGPTAFAAQPYPGELAIAFPGLLRVVGFPLDVPPYPFYVNASSTHPQGKLSQPGYALEATAAPGDASASAQSGQAGADAVVGHALSTAHAWLDGNTYRAEAVNSADLFRIGPLRLAGVRSTAAASVPATGGTPTLTSHLEVAAASVGDVPVTFTPQGVTLAGSSVPLPKDNPITSGLAEAGLSVDYLSASTTPDTVVSPALRIRAIQTFPGIDKQLQVTYLIGSAVAHGVVSTVAGDPVPSVPTPPDAGAIPGTASGGDEAAPSAAAPAGQGTASGTADSPGPRSGLISGSRLAEPGGGATVSAPGGGGPASGDGGGTAAVGEPGLNAEGGPGPDGTVQAALSSSESGLHSTSAEAIYLVVAAGALLAALALHALRQLGVRAPARIGG